MHFLEFWLYSKCVFYFLEFTLNMKDVFEKVIRFEKLTLDKFKSQNYVEREEYKKFDKIDFPIVGIVGLRWVGKTTYLLSRRLKVPSSAYISCDWNFLVGVNIVDLILYMYDNFSITTFYLDEIQFLKNWDSVIKNLYDVSNVKIIFSGSSKIRLEKTSYDLSRRVVLKTLDMFSYLEYINIVHGLDLKGFSFEDLLHNYQQISREYFKYYEKDSWKEEYLKYGEFWYFYAGYKNEFDLLLNNSLKKSIYEDLPAIFNIETKNLSKIERLLFFIANMGASEISINSLAKKVGLDNKVVKNYLEYLQQLWWLYTLFKFWTISENLRKEIKVYLSSTNLMSYLCLRFDENCRWKLRETFFLQNVSRVTGNIDNIFYKKRTDFVVNYNWKLYEFEIGGKSKSRTREWIYIVKDDILVGDQNIIPLRLFGFLK